MNNNINTPVESAEELTFAYDLEVDEAHHTPHATVDSIGKDSRLKRSILSVDNRLNRTLDLIAFISMALLAISMFTQVILRYVFNNPFLGIEETSILLGVWVYFIGMALSIRHRESIHGGILTLVTSNSTIIRSVRLTGSLICLAAVAIFGWIAIEYVSFMMTTGKLSLYLRWPKVIWPLSMVVGFVASFIFFALQVYAEYLDIQNNKQA